MKFKSLISILLILITGLFLFSCSDSSSEPEMFKEIIKGRVLDSDGNPVKNAKIAVNFIADAVDSTGVLVESNVLEYPELQNSTSIMFALDIQSIVSLWVTTLPDSNLVANLIGPDSTMLAGRHEAKWDTRNSSGQNILNGFYKYNFKADSSKMSKLMVLSYTYSNQKEDDIEFLAETDNNGNFSFDKRRIYKDESYKTTNEDGSVKYEKVIFTDYIKLWAVKDGMENSFIDSVNSSFDVLTDKVIIKLK